MFIINFKMNKLFNKEIVINNYNNNDTSHEIEKAIVYENGQVYERNYEYADMEPFNSNMNNVIHNFVVNKNYILRGSDLKNGIVVLERGKDRVYLYPKSKEIEIFEYKKMCTM